MSKETRDLIVFLSTAAREVSTMEQYEIVIQGHLDPRRLEPFAPLAATLLSTGATILVGPVVDQAALHGLLTRIRDLGVPLLRLKRLADAQPHT